MPKQAKRIVHIQSPLGEDRCAVSALSGVERVNDLFSFTVSIIAENDPIKPDELLGEEVTLTIKDAGVERPIHGLVANFTEVESPGAKLFEYDLEVVPKVWLLCLNSHTRIFEEKTVLEIVESVVAESSGMPLELATMLSYRPRETCVQYNESDWAFVARLLAEEGIAFFFKHSKGSATMVLTDSASSFPNCSPASYPYSEHDNADWRRGVAKFRRSGRLATGKIKSSDYSEYASAAPLEVEGKSKAKAKLRPGEREIHGRHEFERSGAGRNLPRGACADQTQRWTESLEADAEYYLGESDVPSLVAGHKMNLNDAPACSDGDKQFLVLEVRHSASEGLDAETVYTNRIRCAPTTNTISFLPTFVPDRPRIWGVQSAKVVDLLSPAADQALAEVKVMFHWDQENASCWARVGQLYAGPQWGGYFVPRIDQEVLVEFINGDPDRPVVVGAVYNQDNPKPPFEQQQSGIHTESANILRFDDSSGAEEFYFEASRNHKFLVLNDDSGEVTNNQSLTVGANRTVDVAGDQSADIGGNQRTTVKGNQDTEVTGNQETKVTGDQRVKVSQKHGLEALKVNMKSDTSVTLEANTSITLKVGGSELRIDQTGVHIKGTMVKVSGNALTEVSSGAVLNLKGGLLKIN